MKKCSCGATIKNENYDKCWKCNNPNTSYSDVEKQIVDKKNIKVVRINELSVKEADYLREDNVRLMHTNAKLNDKVKELEEDVKYLKENNQFLTKSNEAFKKKFLN